MTLTDMTNQEDQSTTTTITTVVESRVEKLHKSQIVSKTTTTETTEKITETFEVKDLNELIPSSSTSSSFSSSSLPSSPVVEIVELADENSGHKPTTIEIVELDEENKSRILSPTEIAELAEKNILPQIQIVELVEEIISGKPPNSIEIIELDEENKSEKTPSTEKVESPENDSSQILSTTEIAEENKSGQKLSVELTDFDDEKNFNQLDSLKYDQKLAVFNSEELEINSAGYQALKSIADLFNGFVCLVGKNECEGKRLINVLNRSNVEFYCLDTSKPECIAKFASYLKSTFNRVDVLVNNFNLNDEHDMADVIDYNYKSILNVFNFLFPLFRPSARVVNVSNRGALLKRCNDRNLRHRISNIQTLDDLNSILDEYIKSFQEKTTDLIGFPCSPLAMSKIAINVLTKIMQKNFDDKNNDMPGLVANTVCPGETGSQIVYLALLPYNYNGPKGSFYIDQDLVDWETGYLLVQKF